MFIAAVLLILLIMIFLYLDDGKISMYIFTATAVICSVWLWTATDTRRDVWKYLAGTGADHDINTSIALYDKAYLSYITVAVITSAAVILISFAGSRLADRICDIFIRLFIIFMGFTNVIMTLEHINKYYDAGRLFMPPLIKAVMILSLSYSVRKIIRTLKEEKTSLI